MQVPIVGAGDGDRAHVPANSAARGSNPELWRRRGARPPRRMALDAALQQTHGGFEGMAVVRAAWLPYVHSQGRKRPEQIKDPQEVSNGLHHHRSRTEH